MKKAAGALAGMKKAAGALAGMKKAAGGLPSILCDNQCKDIESR